MSGSRLAAGARVGLLAAATTSGALVGLGLRHGTSLEPFELFGRSLFASLWGVLPPSVLTVLLGVATHALWMVVWGACFSVVALPLRGLRAAVAALLFSALVGVIALRASPAVLGAASLASLTTSQTLVYLGLLAASLVAGTRIASR